MTHGSLFSGIGGFDLAAEWMGWDNVFHCEWNPFGQKVLNHYWPNAKSYHDITKTDFTIHRGAVDILTGGFPCQPYSLAGKRKGKEDERHLWPEMLRAIREIQPRWVVGENVFGLIGWGGDWYSTKCKLTWKLRGTKFSRMYFQLVPSTLPIEGIGFGLLPTCVSSDATTGSIIGKNDTFKQQANGSYRKVNQNGMDGSLGLARMVQLVPGMLPTPTAMDSTGATANMKSTQVKEGSMHSVTLSRWAGMLPTPVKSDFQVRNPSENWEGNSDLPSIMSRIHGRNSQLSHQFVLEMMGFPTNYLDI